MSSLSRLFSPLRQLAAAFFRHDVALAREKGAVHIVLRERKPGNGKRPDHNETLDKQRQQELTQIRVELAALLNELPETRSTMRHLVFVEQALAKKGLKVLHKLPLDVLRHAHAQLENLVTNWSPVGLANLRSKMAVAIIDREHMNPQAEADAYRTAAVLEHSRQELAEVVEHEHERGDDEALAAAYAALGSAAPSEFQIQGELGTGSGAAAGRVPLGRATQTQLHEPSPEISVRVLQP